MGNHERGHTNLGREVPVMFQRTGQAIQGCFKRVKPVADFCWQAMRRAHQQGNKYSLKYVCCLSPSVAGADEIPYREGSSEGLFEVCDTEDERVLYSG